MKKLKTLAVLLVLTIFFVVFIGNCDDSDTKTEPKEPPSGSEFSISVTGGTANKEKAVFRDVVTLTPGTETGKVFIDWTINPPTVAMLSGNSFTMPQSNVTVTANFEDMTVYQQPPRYVTNNFGEDSSKELLVQWHNDDEVLSQSLRIVRAADSFANAQNITAEYRNFVTSGTIGDYTSRNIFNADAKNLSPNTLYKYRVGSANTGWSQVFYHQTSRDAPVNFSFTVVADSQDASTDQTHMKVTLRTANEYDADNRFFLHCGDVVEQIGADPTQVVSYTNAANDFNVQRPVITTQGNHDTYDRNGGNNYTDRKSEATIFNGFMTFPDNGWETRGIDKSQSYYFYYNNVLFIMLNTLIEYDKFETQANWLRDVLEADRAGNKSRYTIVATHKGPFGNHYYEDGDIRMVRRTFGKVFSDYNVDIVFSGHDHTYCRTNPIKITGTTEETAALSAINFNTTPNGTIYSIPGATGKKLYGELAGVVNPQWDTVYIRRTRTEADVTGGVFVNIKVTPEKLIVTALRTNGNRDKYLPDEYEVFKK
ncbi:MAG: metallophosphoesterase [Treponema sp.]|jgi:hypothetical protein|nr:metallophosphoesterase [Treponema sp.]